MNPLPGHFHRNLTLWRLLGHAWASPNTLIGLILGGLGRSHVQWYHHNFEILLQSGPVLAMCRRMGIAAFTLGDCVLYAVPPTHNLRVHEARHSTQYWLLGPFFLPLYFMLMGIYGYHNHPLERDARAWELFHCGSLYNSQIKSRGNPSQP